MEASVSVEIILKMMNMEVDKVANEMANMMGKMEVDKVAEMAVKIPNEDITCVTLPIGDTYGDDVRGNVVGVGHGG